MVIKVVQTRVVVGSRPKGHRREGTPGDCVHDSFPLSLILKTQEERRQAVRESSQSGWLGRASCGPSVGHTFLLQLHSWMGFSGRNRVCH